MFIVGIILLLLALYILLYHQQKVKDNYHIYQKERLEYNNLRAKGIHTEKPQYHKSTHSFYELIFVILLIISILILFFSC